MKQSKAKSLIETITQITIGYLIDKVVDRYKRYMV